jgi:hypothetical protein
MNHWCKIVCNLMVSADAGVLPICTQGAELSTIEYPNTLQIPIF